jgi:putative transposase
MHGAFLVTVCSHRRTPLFGTCNRGVVTLSRVGELCHSELLAIPSRWDVVELDEWVIMPDHLHFIIRLRAALPAGLSQVVGGYKSGVSRLVAAGALSAIPTIWQRSFHDRKLRTASAIEAARLYIRRNPVNWR